MLLLHISDIHFRAPDCLRAHLDPDRPYRTKLVQDVQRLVADLGPVSAVLVGGDIAFRGAPDEYQVARVWIGELAAVAGCPLARVFVIPGNHDVDRGVILSTPSVRNAQSAILQARQDLREREFRTQITDGQTGLSLIAPLAAYNEFAKEFNCQVFLPDRLYWKQDLDLGGGVSLRVHGLTSTLMSGAEGRDDSRGSLYLSPLQTVLDPLDDIVNLVMCHHPLDWLMDQDDVSDAICGRSSIQMFGHKHSQRIERVDRYVRFSAGAVNPDRREQAWSPGYNLIDLQIVGLGLDRSLKVEAHLRRWQSNPDLFVPIHTHQGETVFRHTLPFPSSNLQSALSEPMTAASQVPNVGTQDTPSKNEHLPKISADTEASMGDAHTRNLVFRFWTLQMSHRREITLKLGLITTEEVDLPEPERYGRALIRAGERGQLEELEFEIAQKEAP